MLKKIIFITVLFALAAGNPGRIYSQNENLSVDEIIARHNKAMGYENADKVKSIKFSINITENRTDVPVTIFVKGKEKARMEASIEGKVFIQIFDDNQGWFWNPFADSASWQKTDKEDEAEMMELIEWEGKLFYYKTKGYTAEVINDSDVTSYNIKLTQPGGVTTNFYVNASDYHITRELKVTDKDDTRVTEDKYPGDLRVIDGIKFPMLVTVKVKVGSDINSETLMEYEEIKLNTEMDDSLFKKTGNK